jgi:hypothetical protein
MLRRLTVYLVLACIISVLYSCSGSQADTIYFYNPLLTPVTIYIDQQPVVVKDSLQSMRLLVGKHALTFGDYHDTVNVTGGTNILINPIRAKLIKQEVVFQVAPGNRFLSRGPDYITPFTIFTADTLRYGGHIVITDDIIVNEWFFNIWQPVAETVDAEKYMDRGVQPGGKNPAELPSFKLHTMKEFMKKTIPLNYDKSFIEYHLRPHFRVLTNVDLVRFNGRYFMAGETEDNLGTMGKMEVTIDDKLWMKDPFLYRPEDHGKILSTLYQLDSCMIKYEDGKTVGPARVLFVKTEESIPLRVVIKELK